MNKTIFGTRFEHAEVSPRRRIQAGYLLRIALLGICCNVAFTAEQPTTLNESVAISKDDLLFAVEEIQSRIQDLTVSFSFNAIKAPSNMLFHRSHMRAAIQGSKIYLDHKYGAAMEENRAAYRREVAYNGKRSTLYEAHTGMASVATLRDQEADTQGKGLFDIMLLNASKEGGYGRNDQSLISLLKSEYSQLRERVEVLNGRSCYVLDLYPLNKSNNSVADTEKATMTVWLDKERGFIPLRTVYYNRSDPTKTLMEFTIEEAVEVQDGIWFAVKGRKKINANGSPASEYVLEVDGWQSGKPSVAINTGVEDELFDLWKRLPTGTWLWDKDVDIAWTIGGDSFDGLAASIGLSLEGMDIPVPERIGVAQVNKTSQKNDGRLVAKPSETGSTQLQLYNQETRQDKAQASGWKLSATVKTAGSILIGTIIIFLILLRRRANV